MSRLARLLVRVFFRRIDVEGAKRMPADGRSCWSPTT